MKTTKKLGIWIDYSNAQFIEYKSVPAETKAVEFNFNQESSEHCLGWDEKQVYESEENEVSEYYKKLGKAIKSYKDVVLFGPSESTIELYHLLNTYQHFEKDKFKIKHTAKLTENQQHAFVKEYFSRR